mgnify:CR=1 FL=1
MANPERNLRAVRIGQVVSDKMDQTVVVKVQRRFPHPLYKRIITRTAKLVAHDEQNKARTGDEVEIVQTRPMSKSKTWRLVRVVRETARGENE